MYHFIGWLKVQWNQCIAAKCKLATGYRDWILCNIETRDMKLKRLYNFKDRKNNRHPHSTISLSIINYTRYCQLSNATINVSTVHICHIQYLLSAVQHIILNLNSNIFSMYYSNLNIFFNSCVVYWNIQLSTFLNTNFIILNSDLWSHTEIQIWLVATFL